MVQCLKQPKERQVDQFYFEDGYVESSFFVYQAEAIIGLGPYFEPNYITVNYLEDRSSFSTLYCDAEIVVGMLIEAQSYPTSEFTVSAVATKSVDATAAFASQFTQSTIGSRGRDIDLFAFSNAAIAVAVDRIRENNVNVSLTFDVATDYVVVRTADSDVDAIFSAIINGLRSRDTSLETQAAFSFESNIIVNREASAICSIETSLSLEPSIIRELSSSQNTSTSQDTSGDRIRFGISAFDIQTTQTVSFRVVRDAHLTGTGVAAITCNPIKTTENSSSISSSFAQYFLGGKVKTGESAFNVYASVFVSRNVGPTGRPRNLVDNYPNQLPSFDSSIKKFGTHSLSGSNNLSFGWTGQNDFIIPQQNEDFYIEVWHYPTSTGTSYTIGGALQFFYFTSVSGAFRFQPIVDYNPSPTGFYRYTHNIAYSANTWYHLAAVKQGNTIAYYINGTRVYYQSDTVLPFIRWGDSDDLGTYWSVIGFYGGNGRIDEAFYVKGSTYGYSTSSTTISVPTAPRTNGPNVEFLYHFNNDVFDDVTLQHLGNANLISSSSFGIDPTLNYDIQSNLTSIVTLNAIIGTIEDINLVAFTNASITASPTLIKPLEASISAEVSQVSNVNVITENASAIDVQASQSIISDRIRDAVISTESIATELVVVDQAIGIVANLFSKFYTSKIYYEEGFIEEGYFLSYEIDAERILSTSSNIQVDSTLTADIDYTADAISLVASSGSLTVDAVKTASGSIDSQIDSTVTSSVDKVVGFNVALQSTCSLTAIVQKGGEIALYAFTNADLSATVDRTRETSSNQTVESSIYFDSSGALNSNGESYVDVVSTLSADANRTRDVSISTESIASELAVIVKTAVADVEVTVQSTLTVSITKTAGFESSITATASETANVNKVAAGAIVINSAMNFAVVIRDLRLDEIEYRIPAEGWEYTIAPEQRLFNIIGETRVRKITQETAIRVIAGETRIHIID